MDGQGRPTGFEATVNDSRKLEAPNFGTVGFLIHNARAWLTVSRVSVNFAAGVHAPSSWPAGVVKQKRKLPGKSYGS